MTEEIRLHTPQVILGLEVEAAPELWVLMVAAVLVEMVVVALYLL
jgi:hypothetical protein